MRIFKYRMRFNAEWIDVSPLINSSDTEIKNSLCTTEYKSVTNTCSFTLIPSEGNGLFYAQIQEKLLQAKNTKTPIDIEISRLSDNVVLFGGYIDNSKLTVTSTKRPDKTSISGNDYIASLLDKKINLNLVYENKSILFIVSNLLKEAGYTGTVDASEALNGKTCKYFVTTDDDDATYRDIIDTLLFEIPGFVLYRNPATRKYEIRQIVGTAEPTRTVSYRLSDKLVTNTKIFDKDGIRIKYPTVDVKEGRPVYVDSVNEGSPAEIPAQHYYPENGDVQATLQEYDKNLLDRAYNTSESRLQNSDLDILYVKNAKLNIFPSNEDNSIFDFPVLQTLDMPSNPVWYPRKAWILLRNKTDKTVNLELMNIEGDVVYKSKINNITLPAKATDPAEYESSYIFDETHASEFARWYYHMQTIATTTSSWTEVNLESELGEKVIVSHKDSAVSQAHVVVQINNVSLGGGIRGYKITAVALSDFGSYEYAKDVRLNSTTKKGIYKEYSEYYNSISETELVGGTWSQTLYIDPKKTLWIRRVVQYTDGTSYISTPVPSGKDGKPGKDGASSYVHIAYANSEDGTLDFSTSISAGKKYLGQCADKNADSPTDPTAYKWTKIEGEKGDKGDPAPYAVQIYTASESKPATSTGTADQVPSGWNTKIPQRTEKQVIWTSIAVVDVKNGQYVYGTWSEPSKYTPDQSDIALIVEWKWGASDVINPDEENTTIALEDDTILSVNGQAVVLGTNDTSWSKTIPEQPADKPYLWKREWQYAYIGDDGTEHQAGWVYYCVTGKLGVEGSYQGLGYTIAGSSIIFAGLDTDGKPTLASFRVSINGDAVAFQRKSFNITQDQSGSFHERYFLVAYWTIGVGNLALCYLTPVSETDSTGAVSYRMKWVAQDGTEIVTTSIDGVSYDPYVLADIKVSGASIKSVTLLNPTKLKAYETDYFMSLMAMGDIGDINTVAKALDIERVFEKVAAMEAFINKLFANQITIMNKIGEDGTTTYGNIHSSGYNKFDYKNNDKVGFFLESTGYAELKNVILKDATIQTNDKDGLPILTTSIANDPFNFSFREEATHWSVEDFKNGAREITKDNGMTLSSYDTQEAFYFKVVRQDIYNPPCKRVYIYPDVGFDNIEAAKKILYEYTFMTNSVCDWIRFQCTIMFSGKVGSESNLAIENTGIYITDSFVSATSTISVYKDSNNPDYVLHVDFGAVDDIPRDCKIKICINLTYKGAGNITGFMADASMDLVMPNLGQAGVLKNGNAPTRTDYGYIFITKKNDYITVHRDYIYYDYVPKSYNFTFNGKLSSDLAIYNPFHPTLKTILNKKLQNGLIYNCDVTKSYIRYINNKPVWGDMDRFWFRTIQGSDSTVIIDSLLEVPGNSVYPFAGEVYILQGSAELRTKSILPAETGKYNLGSDALRFKNIYADNYYPVGSIYMSTRPTSPSLLFGGSWIALDADNTFWFVNWTSTTTDILEENNKPIKIPAGLPNIKGEIFVDSDCGIVKFDAHGTGAFYPLGNTKSYRPRTESGSSRSISFNASKSNSIYGNSNTVQPPAYKVYAWWRQS